ncbi:hypothetical protein DL93DRAFT_1097889 [Clavulina sp. PMI_390]|nr:hypothetical protein DL93DRAFT_1097889 [Clavulina sp. PMI_390]
MSHNNDSHASQHATAPHPAPSSGPRIQPSTSGHVRKASELDTEEGIPTPPTKKSRIASPDHELNLSIKAQGSLPRRTSFLADLYASIRSFGSLSRLWASETRLHVTTILSIPKTSPANYASRLLLARESSASGSSVATPGLALQVDVDEASMSLDPLAGDEVSVRPPTRRLEEAAPEQNHSQPSTHPPNGSANSNTPQSDLDWTLLTRFGIPPGSDLTKLPSSEAIALLNQIYIVCVSSLSNSTIV